MALGVNQSRWIAISLTCRGTNDLFWLLMSIIMILLVIWSSNNAHHAKLWSYGENHLIIFAGLPLPTAAQAGDSWHFAFLDALPSLRTISESLSVRKSLLFEISSIAYIISINSVNIVYVNTVSMSTLSRDLLKILIRLGFPDLTFSDSKIFWNPRIYPASSVFALLKCDLLFKQVLLSLPVCTGRSEK